MSIDRLEAVCLLGVVLALLGIGAGMLLELDGIIQVSFGLALLSIAVLVIGLLIDEAYSRWHAQ